MRFPWSGRRKDRRHELQEELDAHFAIDIQQRIEAGCDPAEAGFASRRDFGNVSRVKEVTREMWGGTSLERLIQDIRHSLRRLWKAPAFAITTVLTLALGIGATTAIFSVVDAVLLRSLPYRDAHRLVAIYEDRSRTGFPRKEFTPANYVDCKTQKGIFDDVAAIDADRFYNLTGGAATPERLSAEGVTHNLFSLLGVQALFGHVFSPQEDRPGSEHVVLISHRLWLGRFGGDRSVIGRDILLNGEKYSVVGVMPPGFSFPNKNADLWVPTAFTSQDLADRGSHFLMVVALLRPGVTIKQANAQLLVLSQRLRRQHMDVMQFVDSFIADPLQNVYTRDVRAGLILLLAAVGFILLIACANIANLLLSRAVGRQREIALRAALGAARSRIVRQLLTESAVLAIAGGVLGILLAEGNFRFLRNLIPEDLSRTVSVTLDLPVLAFAILISLVSTFMFGLAPALQTSKVDISESLKEGGRAGVGVRRKNVGNSLVIGEIALSLMLLVASGLLIESFANLRHLDPGFRSDHVLTARIDVPETSYRSFSSRTQFFQTVLERVRVLPGVERAGFSSPLPLLPEAGFVPEADFVPEGVVRPDIEYGALDHVVSPGYFEAMRIPLMHGRLFDSRDGPSAPSVAVINETMARKFWRNQNALGKRFRIDLGNSNFRSFQIVGVVGDVRQMSLDAVAKEEMYFPYWQAEGNYMMPRDLVIRITGNPMDLAGALRKTVWAVAPDQPVSDVRTMDDIVDHEVGERRIQTVLLGGLAALALVLACVGIYGVVAYLVTQEHHQIGIRAALGATPRGILRLVLARASKLTFIGLSIGILAALLITRFMKSLLFGVSGIDPLPFVAAAILLTSVALLASYLPARTAMRIDPVIALRCE
ncbi:MAG: ABC transporter permease [Acidobacteriaceae bacterium]|nr:ABC transporter permease [Acidobacteriaceae bacterium]